VTIELPPTIEQSQQTPPRLYDLRGLDIGTFLGSWFAGGFLLSRNLRALGRTDAARNVLLIAFLSLVPLALLTYTIVVPEKYERLLAFTIQGAQVAIVHFAALRMHGAALSRHASSGGQFFSRWRAAGVSLLLLPVPLCVLLGVALAFPDLPALKE